MKRRIFQANKTSRQIIYGRLVLVALVIVVLLFWRGVWYLWQKSNLAQVNLIASESHLKQLEERKKMLGNKLKKLETPRGIEEEIRTNFSVVKPGEKVINIVDPNKATTTATTTPLVRHWWQIF